MQQLHEDGGQRSAPLERVQVLEERLAKLAAAGDAAAAATAQQLQQEVEELRGKACLAQADADKASCRARLLPVLPVHLLSCCLVLPIYLLSCCLTLILL